MKNENYFFLILIFLLYLKDFCGLTLKLIIKNKKLTNQQISLISKVSNFLKNIISYFIFRELIRTERNIQK